jgi:hypothetical protein
MNAVEIEEATSEGIVSQTGVASLSTADLGRASDIVEGFGCQRGASEGCSIGGRRPTAPGQHPDAGLARVDATQ